MLVNVLWFHSNLQVHWRVSGADGCPGQAVLRAVGEDLRHAPNIAGLPQVGIIARAKPRSRRPATQSNVKVSVLTVCRYDKVPLYRKNPLWALFNRC